MLLAAAFLALFPVPVAAQSRLIALPDGAVAYVPARAGSDPPLLVILHGAGQARAYMLVPTGSEQAAFTTASPSDPGFGLV
jgi:hypothetical protein